MASAHAAQLDLPTNSQSNVYGQRDMQVHETTRATNNTVRSVLVARVLATAHTPHPTASACIALNEATTPACVHDAARRVHDAGTTPQSVALTTEYRAVTWVIGGCQWCWYGVKPVIAWKWIGVKSG